MTKEEKTHRLIKELLETTNEEGKKENATIVLSSFESEKENGKVAQVIAANGSGKSISVILLRAMEENSALRQCIQNACNMYALLKTAGKDFPLNL